MLPDWITILLKLLTQFTGGRGGIDNVIVNYGIAAIFYAVLLAVANSNYRENPQPREKLLRWGFGVGLSRELFMLIMATIYAFGAFPEVTLHSIFPPLEHFLNDSALILIAGAYVRFHVDKADISRRYLLAALASTVLVYLSTFWWWANYIEAHPASKFGQVWCEWLFRVNATFWLLVPTFYIFGKSQLQSRITVVMALSLFALSEFLKIPDIVLHEDYEYAFTPVARLLYLSGIFMLGYVYFREQFLARKHAEQSLAASLKKLGESEKLLEGIVENIPVMVFLKRASDLCFELFNRAGEKLLGYSRNDLLGKGNYDFWPKEEGDWFTAADRKVLASTEPTEIPDEKITTASGEIRYLHTWKTALRNESGEPSYLLGISVDITEQKRIRAQLAESENRLQTIINNEPECIKILDAQGRLILMNPAGLAMIEADSLEQVKGNSVLNIITPECRSAFEGMLKQVIAGEAVQLEFEIIGLKGKRRWLESHSVPMEDNGETVLLAVTRDVSEKKRAESALRESEMRLRIMLENEVVGIVTSKDRIIQWANPAYEKLLGYEKGELNGVPSQVIFANDDEYQKLGKNAYPVINAGRVFRSEVIYQRKDGRHITVDVSGGLLPETGETLWTCVDITERKKVENELNFIAHYDGLTGVPNRILLADRMKQAIAQTARENNMMAVCYLDLDGFKPINDTFGHEAGDRVLIEVARRIEHTIRSGDTVARLGGDEFVVLLLKLERGEECVSTLERLLAAIAEPITVKDQIAMVSASIGVSIYPLDDEDPDTLLRHADQAMYSAKLSGKNRFYIFDPTMGRRARDQNEFLQSIQYALEQNQFELHYQPKVCLRTRELVGAEALIRWRHPQRGLLSPAEFLHHIENTNLDIALGEWVTKTALDQMNEWRSAGLDIEVNINISGYHMESEGFAEKLGQQLAQYPDLPHGKLQIEVLETVALNDIAVVRGIIESCREIGVKFALDDFGTGYSSLSYLSKLPVDTLKIDQSFVRDMLEDSGDMAIVQGIVALAHAFDRQTVAEGIETEDHYRILLDMGCDLGQGYFMARPMPAQELPKWQANF